MSEKMQRIGILLIAVIFFITTIGIALYSIIFSNNNNDTLSEAELQKLLQQQKEEPKVAITCTQDPALNYTPAPPLQGKPLPNFVPTETLDGLSCIDVVVGTGAEATAGGTVTANYTGAVMKDGTVFQSSYDSGQPIAFSLAQVIAGWSQGVPGMKEGGKRRILIPAALAYGESPPQGSGIPANANLVFDIELVKAGQ